jgi:hypothetical protein
MTEPEEDELVPCIVTGKAEDGTLIAEVLTDEQILDMTLPNLDLAQREHMNVQVAQDPDGTVYAVEEPGSPAPLQTIDQREQDVKNRIASARYNHTPGLRHTLKFDNITYDVDRNGAWHRVTPRLCAKHHNMKNHSVARRARRGVV